MKSEFRRKWVFESRPICKKNEIVRLARHKMDSFDNHLQEIKGLHFLAKKKAILPYIIKDIINDRWNLISSRIEPKDINKIIIRKKLDKLNRK